MTFFAPILEALPPNVKLRQIAAYLLLFAPLAMILGLLLRWTQPAPPPLAIQYDREGWIDLGRASAGRFGIDTSSWNAGVEVDHKEDDHNEGQVRRYASRGARSQLRERLHPPMTVRLRLHEPGGKREFEVHFAPSGDLVSWSMRGHIAAQKLPPEVSRPQAIAAADKWLQPYGAVTLSDWRTTVGDEETNPGWEANAQFAASPKERYRVELGLEGSTVVSASIHDENEGGASGSAIGSFEEFLGVCGAILICLFLLYSLRLFRRRRREGEIPRERAWVLIAIFGVCGGLFVALNPDSYGHGSSITMSVVRTILKGLGTSLLYGAGGLFVSAAYASGEGEIREGWPGKLISFDALLAGKWSTQPVGVSAAVAATVAAWVFFLAACAWRLDPPQASLLIDKDLLEVAVGRNLLVRSLVDLPLRVSFLIVAGLFMPLAFIHRRHWTGWKVWAVLLACPFLVHIAFRTFSLSGIGPLTTTLGVIVALVVPFYYVDVLAAVLGALLYTSLVTASAIATAVPGVASTEALLLLLITAGLVPMIAAAWRGKTVDERAVRPTYARNLAERLSLQAEVSAAREAQLRLLPAAMPQRTGLSVAAYCQPAGVVGGDFYDFFPAPDGQLGVFVASGSGMGLASALTIALAKGFLASEVRRGEDPGTSLQSLLKALSGRVGAAAEETGLLVALVDPAHGGVRMARRGKYPAVWLMRGKDFAPAPFNGNSGHGVEVGSIAWQSGDVLVLSTEGFTALLDDQSLAGQRSWLNTTARRTIGAEAGLIENDLMRRLGGRKGKRLRKLRRDLTTVVLRNQTA
jgi:hypothetical protein